MKSVAIIGCRGYPSYYGGFETLVRKLAPHLANHGWDVTVYSRRGAVVEDDAGRCPAVTTKYTRGVERKSFSTVSFGASATADAAYRKVDVALVLNVANGFWLPLLRARGVPTIVNVDGIEWERAKWSNLAKGVFRAGARLTASFATELIYDSHNIAARWESEFSRTGEFIPYGGVPFESPEAPLDLPSRGYVLAVARLVPENTVQEFLSAAAELSKRWPVVLVGSSGYGGPIDDQARSLAQKNSSFRWLGQLSDDPTLFALWNHAGAYFHGHSVGGTNPALVQAMACGAPIVALDTVFNREVMGDHAMYVQPVPDQICEHVDAVMSSPSLQKQLSEEAKLRAHEQYSWESVCDRYEEVLECARSATS